MQHHIRLVSPTGIATGQFRRSHVVCLGAAWRRTFQEEPARDLQWLGIVLCAVSAVVTLGSLTYIATQFV
jgi:hypothetical protein